MTEPTYHYRPDVVAQLEYLLDATRDQDSRALERAAREALRTALANAWTAGWVAGFTETPPEPAPAQNPYDETDKA